MGTFFTSDWHLGHAKINQLAGRPFESTEEMNEEIIRRHNERVTNSDIVFVHGDTVMGNFKENLKLVQRMNGVKLLIPGNHDRVHPAYEIKDAKRTEAYAMYREAGFKILPIITYHTAPNAGVPFVMCHFPYLGDSQDVERYSEYRPKFNSSMPWLVHGHVHEKWKVNGTQINVGVDVWDFYPVSLEEIQEIIKNNS